MSYSYYNEIIVPESKNTTCKICHITDNTQTGDLDNDWHKGFTIWKGKVLYWMMIWHQSGHVTVYSSGETSPRWIDGDTLITIHWK